MDTQSPVESVPPITPTPEIAGSASLEVSGDDVLTALVGAYGKNASAENRKKFNELLSGHLKQIVGKHVCSQTYNILVMYDNTVLAKTDSDRIYQAIMSLKDKTKPLLLILLSK